MTYTIEKTETVSQELFNFWIEQGNRLAALYQHSFDWMKFDLFRYLMIGEVWVVKRNDKVVGVMLGRMVLSVLDGSTRILVQDILYCAPGSGRGAHLLMRAFIDFGRQNADHIFTVIGKSTNIKARSLERLGFEECEVHFRMRV